MYCVVQEVLKRKKSKPKVSKEILVDSWNFGGNVHYNYKFSDEKFERDVSKSYSISIRQSKRVKGVVTKKQFHVTTIDYYDIAEGFFPYEEFIVNRESRLKKISLSLDVSFEDIMDTICNKMDPLVKSIKDAFELTDEYKAKLLHDATLKEHLSAEKIFEKTYGTGSYTQCYDVFGTLRNPERLKYFIKRDEEINRKAREAFKKRREDFFNGSGNYKTYSSNDYNKAYKEPCGSKSNIDKAILKKFYKVLAAKFHPDVGGDNELMKKVNVLKIEWGV